MAKFLTIATLVLAFVTPVSGKTNAAGSEDSGIIPCSIFQKVAALKSLKEVFEMSSTIWTCANGTGYDFYTAMVLPKTHHMPKICASLACCGFIDTLELADPPNCDLHIPWSNTTFNLLDLVYKVKDECGVPPHNSTILF